MPVAGGIIPNKERLRKGPLSIFGAPELVENMLYLLELEAVHQHRHALLMQHEPCHALNDGEVIEVETIPGRERLVGGRRRVATQVRKEHARPLPFPVYQISCV